jgi:hypothetical protein
MFDMIFTLVSPQRNLPSESISLKHPPKRASNSARLLILTGFSVTGFPIATPFSFTCCLILVTVPLLFCNEINFQ